MTQNSTPILCDTLPDVDDERDVFVPFSALKDRFSLSRSRISQLAEAGRVRKSTSPEGGAYFSVLDMIGYMADRPQRRSSGEESQPRKTPRPAPATTTTDPIAEAALEAPKPAAKPAKPVEPVNVDLATYVDALRSAVKVGVLSLSEAQSKLLARVGLE